MPAVTEAGKDGQPLARDFFYEEYILNHKIATMKKPFVALVHGISMGGVSICYCLLIKYFALNGGRQSVTEKNCCTLDGIMIASLKKGNGD